MDLKKAGNRFLENQIKSQAEKIKEINVFIEQKQKELIQYIDYINKLKRELEARKK